MTPQDPALFAISLDFALFGLTLIGVAVFHHHTMRVALIGLVTISIYKIAFTGFNLFPEVRSVGAWVEEGWLTAVAYVVGFAVLLMLLGWHPAPKLRPEHGPPGGGITQVNNR